MAKRNRDDTDGSQLDHYQAGSNPAWPRGWDEQGPTPCSTVSSCWSDAFKGGNNAGEFNRSKGGKIRQKGGEFCGGETVSESTN